MASMRSIEGFLPPNGAGQDAGRVKAGHTCRPLARRLLPAALSLCWLWASPPAPAQYLQGADFETAASRVGMMIESGAWDLALRRIDTLQDAARDDAKWLEWERRRYELYHQRGDWDALAERLLHLPGEIPAIRRQELATHAAELLVEAGRGDSARRILRRLIWRGGGGDSRQLQYWRRLVVRSYIVAGLAQDAKIAMGLYEREYLPRDAGWDYLFAQVLLRHGDATLAAERLGSAQDPAARVLRLLSRLRAGVDAPETVLDAARALREELTGEPALRAATWAVAAEAATRAADLPARVEALEQLLNGPGLPPELGLFQIDAADLWEAYAALGSRLGNARNLLFGDPEPWLDLAARLEEAGSGLEARATYAAAARRSRGRPQAARLHQAFYERLRQAGLTALAVRLYQVDALFPSVDAVPDRVRHGIVADAIKRRDVGLAARFARDLAAPGAGQTPLQWDLTRARLALFAGDFERSETLLRALVRARPSFAPEQADRVMQPIFDLQSVGRAEAAFELFQSLHDRVESEQQREILMWLGDARNSSGHYESAAEYYLRSAYARSGPRDQWGRTARYNAAGALAEAGLFEDARRLYEQILEEVGEGKRAAALQRRLQELWVKEQEAEAAR